MINDKLFLAGWGFKDEIVSFILDDLDFDVIAWSLGIVRFQKLLEETNLYFNRVLFVSCQKRFSYQKAVDFRNSFHKDPVSCLRSFYRKVFWGIKNWKKDFEDYIFLSPRFSEINVLKKQLDDWLFQKVDVQLMRERCGEIYLILTKKDLVIPFFSQKDLAKDLQARSFEISEGHFCLRAVREIFM